MRESRRFVSAALGAFAVAVMVPTACSSFSLGEIPDGGGSAADVTTPAEEDADSAVVPDADASAVEGGWPCGADTCPLTQVCCWFDLTDASALGCTGVNDCSSGASFRCRDDEDCVLHGDLHCCGSVDGFRLLGSSCSAQDCVASSNLCDYALNPDPCAGADSGLSCQQASAPHGFAYCRP